MLKRYQTFIDTCFRLFDASVIGVAWLVSYLLRFDAPSLKLAMQAPSFVKHAAMTPLVAVLWAAVFSTLRVYESRRMVRLLSEFKLVLKAHGFALLLFMTLSYFIQEARFSRLLVAYFAVISGLGLVLFRGLLRKSLRALHRRSLHLRHVLIMGEGALVTTLIRRLEWFPEIGLRVAGIVTQEGSAVTEIEGRPVLGHFGQINELTASTGADEVLIALPASQQDQTNRILHLLEDETVDVRLVPDVHAHAILGCAVENFDGVPVVRINDSPLIGLAAMAKVATDFVLASIALFLLSPLLLLIAALVKLTSPGPVFYGQERMGLDGRSFKMWKFRSMRSDAEAQSGAVWARAGDDRRTAFGTFLRKTSLDELPQFWNVVCGDMALVGPRPERPVFVQQFRSQIPHYMLRHKVKAGITGWAQVNGWRGNTSLDRRIECDLYYIQNWTYGFDLKILTLTLWKGFINKNAY